LKKLIFGIALIVAGALFAYAQQYCPESDFRVAPVGDGVSIQIVEYLGDNWTVNIPSRIRNLPVTHIGNRAFMNSQLSVLVIPASVTSFTLNKISLDLSVSLSPLPLCDSNSICHSG